MKKQNTNTNTNESTHSEMCQVRQNPIQCYFLYVNCIS